MAMSNGITGRVSMKINAPVEKVWLALTDPDQIRQYFFGTNTKTDWKVGSPIIWEGEWEGKSYRDKGTVLDLEVEKLIKYDYWSSMSRLEDKPENYVIVTYLLERDGDGTELTIIQENVPTEEQKEHSEQNWTMVMEGLKKMVEE
jgi:uncharacterized protein YndB with AHSA1/START domain